VSPVAARRDSAPVPSSRPRLLLADAPAELLGLRVLVLDDEADARELVATVLGECGAHVTTVASAAEAFAAIDRSLPDVVISDIAMPDVDGYAFIRKLRARTSASGRDIPAAALTAYARVEDRRRALVSGFQMHLPKPIEPAELLAVVGSLARLRLR
jgi:CheY-like chemotaxis protein